MTATIPAATIAGRLSAYLDSIDGSRPFCWQTNNCSHCAFGWWGSVTGADPLLGVVMPAGAASAPRWLHRQGCTFVELVASLLGRPRIDPRLAQPGDLVIIGATSCGAGGLGAALGVCTGRLAAVLSPDGQLVRVPMAAAQHAFALDQGRA